MPEESNSKNNVMAVVLLIAILVVGSLYFIFKKPSEEQQTTINQEAKIEYKKENIEVSQVNLASAKSVSDRLPAGFPTKIPVEITGIYESNTLQYKDRGLIQYTVSYKTSKSVSDKYKEYISYMKSSGFVISAQTQDEFGASIVGTKGEGSLSIYITSSGGKNTVSLAYIEKK